MEVVQHSTLIQIEVFQVACYSYSRIFQHPEEEEELQIEAEEALLVVRVLEEV